MGIIALPAFSMNMVFEELPMFDSEISSQKKSGGIIGPKRPTCGNLKFSLEQKKAYKDVRQIFMNETKKQRQRFRRLHQNYKKILRNPKISGHRADKVAVRIRKVGGKLKAARTDFFHTVVYDVATPGQRKPLLQCVRKMRHYMMKKKLHQKHKNHHPKK